MKYWNIEVISTNVIIIIYNLPNSYEIFDTLIIWMWLILCKLLNYINYL